MGLVLATSHPFEASQHKKASETFCSMEKRRTPAASRHFVGLSIHILPN